MAEGPAAVPWADVTLAEHLAGYAESRLSQPLDPEIVHALERLVIDWFGATIAGGASESAARLASVLGEGVVGVCPTYPSGRALPPHLAALVNGTAAHAVEVDDIYREGIFHPGAPVIAAALAAAQGAGVDGGAFMRAVLVGYETSTRIAEAVNPSHYGHWHTTGTVGALGAALAAAGAMGLDREAAAHALAQAATMAAGLRRTVEGGAAKPLHAGRAAETGVLCARLAAAGGMGPLDILEAPGGFVDGMCDAVDWTPLSTLGVTHNVLAITLKSHDCCGHAFAAIDAALALREKHHLASAPIVAVAVETYGTAVDVAGQPAPLTPEQARFSIPFTVATALLRGAVTSDAFDVAALEAPEVKSLCRRVSIAVDPELDAGFPARRAARVTVRLESGQVFSHLQPTRHGDPDDPLSDEEVEAKFRRLVEPVIGSAAATALLAALWNLEDASDLRFDAAVARPEGITA